MWLLSKAMCVLAILCAGPGCTVVHIDTVLSLDQVRARWLPPIRDGQTSVQELSAKLGEPSARFQGGRVLVYRLALVDPGSSMSEATYRDIMWRRVHERFAPRDDRLALSHHGMLRVVRHDTDTDLCERLLLAREAEYHLVLAVDRDGHVRKHRLVRVLP